MTTEALHGALRHTIDRFYQAVATQDLALLGSVVTEDWQYIPPAREGQGGASQLAQAFEDLAVALTDMHIELLDVLIHENKVGVRARVTGRQTGPWMGLAASASQVDFAVHSFHEVRDGRICKTWHLEDWLGLFRQIGGVPPDLSIPSVLPNR
jgi:predicted ester cyclase